jgi:hypothetical protein
VVDPVTTDVDLVTGRRAPLFQVELGEGEIEEGNRR